MTDQLTFGVLGHVDHGKTALVKTLTGTDTDRLEEEKRRGLSIVLGFAYLEHDQGIIDFIDAPGHEDFIRTMISGATGIDAALLVIAADEGIKPQTREHFAIAQLLGIKQGLIVINKTDLVDSSRLAATQNEIMEAVRGTFLEHAPLHAVSARTGDGIDALTAALASTIASKQARSSADSFYLPLDRVFTIDGIGTVGTGTLRNGALRCDDEVQIMPAANRATIREIQVHNRQVDEASPGQRVAVSLRSVKRDGLQRGNVLIRPGTLQESSCLHARLQILDDLVRLPKRNELVRVLFGTTEVLAKMRVVGDDKLESGTNLLVQFRCREPVIVSTGEYFIARTSSPIMTFGGGEILDTSEDLLRQPTDSLIAYLKKLEHADVETKIEANLQIIGYRGISLTALAERTIASAAQVDAVLVRLNAVIVDDSIAIARSAFDKLSERVIRALEHFHNANPTALGQDLDLFRAEFLDLSSSDIIAYLLQYLSDTKTIDLTGNTLRLAAFNPDDNIDAADREAIESVEQLFRDGGTATPSLDDVLGDDPARTQAYQYLKDNGKLVAIKDHGGKTFIVFHRDTINAVKNQLSEAYPPPKHFTVSDFRVMTGSTRKYVIPMLEYFDRNRITIRQGDKRSLSRIEK